MITRRVLILAWTYVLTDFMMPTSIEAFTQLSLRSQRKNVMVTPSQTSSFLPIYHYPDGGLPKLSPQQRNGAVVPLRKGSVLPIALCHECARPTSTSLSSAIGSSDVNTNSDEPSSSDSGGWKEHLLKVSNFASLLCVLDCTVLPLVTIVLPFFGIVAASPAQMEYLHELGHKIALFFVMPVGGLATTMNYTNHRKKWIASMGIGGLMAIFLSNVGCHWGHALPAPAALGALLHKTLHVLHHGVIHRLANLGGCFLLLFSNYVSHRSGGCKDPNCTHKHHSYDHSHEHGS